jgi:hypothetical protein
VWAVLFNAMHHYAQPITWRPETMNVAPCALGVPRGALLAPLNPVVSTTALAKSTLVHRLTIIECGARRTVPQLLRDLQ